MQTPVTNRNPLAAVAPPAPQRPAATIASGGGGGFGDALAREVSQHGSRVQDEHKSQDQTNEAASGDATGKPGATTGKPDAPDASATPAGAATAADTAGPVDASAASGLLALVALVANLTPKAIADAKTDPAVRDDARDVAVAGRGSDRGQGPDQPLALATDGRARAEPAGVTAKVSRQGDAGQAVASEAFAATLDRVGEDVASREAASALRLEAIPQGSAAQVPAAVNAAVSTATLAPGGERLAPRVGTPAWDNALGHRMVWMAGAHEQTASLTLNPPDLGPLQVVLSVSNNHADAMFVATQPEVRQALEAAMPRLRDMLGEAGLTLRDATVSADTRDSQQAFRQAQRNAGSSSRGDRHGEVGAIDSAIASVPVRAGRTLVDTFA